jgi:carboxymethylenebutenolidase
MWTVERRGRTPVVRLGVAMGETVALDGPAGTLGLLVERAAAGAPAVVLLHSWWGLTGHFRRVSRRLAGAGFTAVAVDLYAGRCTDDPRRARELRVGLTNEAALAAGGAAVEYAGRIAGGGVGVLGFSMGAELALRLAAARADRVDAVVAFYGACVPDDLAQLRAPVQLHVATDDEFALPEEIGELVARLVALDKRLELYTYRGTRHGFFNADHPESHHEAAAESAWAATRTFLAATLAGQTAAERRP